MAKTKDNAVAVVEDNDFLGMLAEINKAQDAPSEGGAVAEYFEGESKPGYLQRLQLFSKGEAVETEKIGPGRYGVPSGETIRDLGTSIDLLVLARRPKALDVSDREAPRSYYDPTLEEFKTIERLAAAKTPGYHAGTTFLVFVRGAGFLEFFCATKSAKRIAPELAAFRPGMENAGPCTLGSKRVKKGNWSWHAPTVMKCSVPIELPTSDVLRAEVERFQALGTAAEAAQGAEVAEAPTRE